ncbi:substrate-binding periplasmic protein [Pseudomonas jessenii]|uniref:substrate-binding periplasmic protein n=1 Tax=Pseudomonas jessenii TaxID=77298 RepID=UPI0038916CE1
MIHNNIRLSFIISVTFLFSTAAHAVINIVTFPIPGHVESESKGLFIELTHEVAHRAGTDIAINVLPPLRAVHEYFDGSYAVLFPALDVTFAPGQPITRTAESIDCKEDFVFTRKGSQLLKTLDDLKGKHVGITRGYPYAREITENKEMIIEAAASDETNIRKLIAGHLDAFILDEKTGVQAFQDLGLVAQMQYAPKVPVSRQDVYYAFQNTADGEALAAKFSLALNQMKASGRYHEITRGVTIGEGCPKKESY